MLSHRIYKTEDHLGTVMTFPQAWRKLFSNETIDIGDKVINQFDYISFRTNERPRDLIFYVKQCADVASQKGWEIIRASTVINGERAYSDYFRHELIDELYPLFPEIEKIFRALTKLNKGSFKAQEFYDVLDRMNERNEIVLSKLLFTPPQVLDILYRFDIIGNRSSTGHTVYHHSSDGSTIDYDRQIIVHVGLLRTLQIGNPRLAVPVQNRGFEM